LIGLPTRNAPHQPENRIRSNHAFALAVATSLVVGAALMFGSLHAAASHLQVTM
jgi:hypothetical protein